MRIARRWMRSDSVAAAGAIAALVLAAATQYVSGSRGVNALVVAGYVVAGAVFAATGLRSSTNAGPEAGARASTPTVAIRGGRMRRRCRAVSRRRSLHRGARQPGGRRHMAGRLAALGGEPYRPAGDRTARTAFTHPRGRLGAREVARRAPAAPRPDGRNRGAARRRGRRPARRARRDTARDQCRRGRSCRLGALAPLRRGATEHVCERLVLHLERLLLAARRRA